MKLESELFDDDDTNSAEQKLTDFVNSNGISRADIQSIAYIPDTSYISLFYWEH